MVFNPFFFIVVLNIQQCEYYIKEATIKTIPPFSLLLVLPIILFPFLKFKNSIAWILMPFIVVHTLIGHKELRFIFPILGFLPIIIILVLEKIKDKYIPTLLNNKYFLIFAKFFFMINFILLGIIIIRPLSHKIYLFKTIYSKYTEPTTIFYINDHPYFKNYEVHFYKRDEVVFKEIKSFDDIQPDTLRTNLMIVHFNNRPEDIAKKYRLVYSSYPEYLTKLNITNRFSRKTWYVYEITN